MNQTRARDRQRRRPEIADAAALRSLAFTYVGRYATTRARLATYLRRKIREADRVDLAGDVDAIADQCVALGFVDDAAFAVFRAQALHRRGFGARRVTASLRQSGVDADTASRAGAEGDAEAIARIFARKRRIGPYGPPVDQKVRQKHYAAMVRAGHPPAIISRILGEASEDLDESDIDQNWP